jgi:peptide/nickel transport system permease protein
MRRYVASRLLLFPPTLALVSIAVFLMMRVLPGDVALLILGGSGETTDARSLQLLESYRQALGLADPLPVQYLKWAWSMINGQFGGASLIDHEPVKAILARRFPVTLELALLAFTIGWLVAIPLGVLAAYYHNRWPDYAARIPTQVGYALPNFWVALLVLLVLNRLVHWNPPLFFSPFLEDPLANLSQVIWPALIQAWAFSATAARVTRSSLLEVMGHDYIRTARSKGLNEWSVAFRHGLRSAIIPVITIGGTQLGVLLGGTVILETVFGLPGIGQALVQSAQMRDYPVIQSFAVVLVALVLLLNLCIDMLYAALDPRIRYT